VVVIHHPFQQLMMLLLLPMIIIILDDDDDDGIVSVCLSASLIDEHTKSFGLPHKEQLYRCSLCSLCDPANKNWMKKSENMPVWISIMLLAYQFFTVLQRLVKGTAKPNTCSLSGQFFIGLWMGYY